MIPFKPDSLLMEKGTRLDLKKKKKNLIYNATQPYSNRSQEMTPDVKQSIKEGDELVLPKDKASMLSHTWERKLNRPSIINVKIYYIQLKYFGAGVRSISNKFYMII